jgi:4-hydroxybenzoate polyprenyltransferase
MIIEVHRGVDEQISFKGIKGRYLYMLGAGIGGTVVLLLFLYIIGINGIFVFIGAFLVSLYIYYQTKVLSDKHGAYGHLTSQHQRLNPKAIIQNVPFHKILRNDSQEN